MKRELVIAAGALALSLAPMSFAQEGIILYGLGGSSCGALVQAYREGAPNIGVQSEGRVFSASSNLYAQWLSGFFSSYNTFSAPKGDFSGRVGIEGLTEWVRSYCEKNPTHTINRAATECIRAVGKKE